MMRCLLTKRQSCTGLDGYSTYSHCGESQLPHFHSSKHSTLDFLLKLFANALLLFHSNFFL